MAKFFGHVGFGSQEVEISPGVYDYKIVERPYFGEVVRDAMKVVGGQTILSESKTTNSFRIMADGYASENFFDMQYVRWMGRYWEITQVELQQRPRMIIRIGGVWNGPTAEVEAPGAP